MTPPRPHNPPPGPRAAALMARGVAAPAAVLMGRGFMKNGKFHPIRDGEGGPGQGGQGQSGGGLGALPALNVMPKGPASAPPPLPAAAAAAQDAIRQRGGKDVGFVGAFGGAGTALQNGLVNVILGRLRQGKSASLAGGPPGLYEQVADRAHARGLVKSADDVHGIVAAVDAAQAKGLHGRALSDALNAHLDGMAGGGKPAAAPPPSPPRPSPVAATGGPAKPPLFQAAADAKGARAAALEKMIADRPWEKPAPADPRAAAARAAVMEQMGTHGEGMDRPDRRGPGTGSKSGIVRDVGDEARAAAALGNLALPTGAGGKLDANLEDAYRRAAAQLGFEVGEFKPGAKAGHVTAKVARADFNGEAPGSGPKQPEAGRSAPKPGTTTTLPDGRPATAVRLPDGQTAHLPTGKAPEPPAASPLASPLAGMGGANAAAGAGLDGPDEGQAKVTPEANGPNLAQTATQAPAAGPAKPIDDREAARKAGIKEKLGKRNDRAADGLKAAEAKLRGEGAGGLSKTDIEHLALKHWRDAGGDTGADDDAALADHYQPFAFHKELPGEVKSFLEGRGHLKKLFTTTDDASKAGGHDAMGALGDRYWDVAEGRGAGGAGDVRRAMDFLRQHPDPNMNLLADLHDTADNRASRARAQVVKPHELAVDDVGSIHGHPVRVTEDAEGNRILTDGGAIRDTPLDAIDTPLPFDKGSLHHQGIDDDGPAPTAGGRKGRRKGVPVPARTQPGDDGIPFSRAALPRGRWVADADDRRQFRPGGDGFLTSRGLDAMTHTPGPRLSMLLSRGFTDARGKFHPTDGRESGGGIFPKLSSPPPAAGGMIAAVTPDKGAGRKSPRKQTPKPAGGKIPIDPEAAEEFARTGRATSFRVHDARSPLPEKSRNMWEGDDEEFMPGVSGYANFTNALDDLLTGRAESVTGENYSSNIEGSGGVPCIVVMRGRAVDGPGAEVVVPSPKVAAVFTAEEARQAMRDAVGGRADLGTDDLESIEGLLLRRFRDKLGKSAPAAGNESPRTDGNAPARLSEASRATFRDVYGLTDPEIDDMEANGEQSAPLRGSLGRSLKRLANEPEFRELLSIIRRPKHAAPAASGGTAHLSRGPGPRLSVLMARGFKDARGRFHPTDRQQSSGLFDAGPAMGKPIDKPQHEMSPAEWSGWAKASHPEFKGKRPSDHALSTAYGSMQRAAVVAGHAVPDEHLTPQNRELAGLVRRQKEPGRAPAHVTAEMVVASHAVGGPMRAGLVGELKDQEALYDKFPDARKYRADPEAGRQAAVGSKWLHKDSGEVHTVAGYHATGVDEAAPVMQSPSGRKSVVQYASFYPQYKPAPAAGMSPVVDTNRQYGIFAKDAAGNPAEVGEKPGQANLFQTMPKAAPPPEKPAAAAMDEPGQMVMESGLSPVPVPAKAGGRGPGRDGGAEVVPLTEDLFRLHLADGKYPTLADHAKARPHLTHAVVVRNDRGEVEIASARRDPAAEAAEDRRLPHQMSEGDYIEHRRRTEIRRHEEHLAEADYDIDRMARGGASPGGPGVSLHASQPAMYRQAKDRLEELRTRLPDADRAAWAQEHSKIVKRAKRLGAAGPALMSRAPVGPRMAYLLARGFAGLGQGSLFGAPSGGGQRFFRDAHGTVHPISGPSAGATQPGLFAFPAMGQIAAHPDARPAALPAAPAHPASTEPHHRELAGLHESSLVAAEDTHKALTKPYEGGASSRNVPNPGYPYKPGTWRVEKHFGIYGRDAEKLVELDPHSLEVPEGDYTKEGHNPEGRGSDADRYAQWSREGKTPPPISVNETDSGSMRVLDGHRRVAAAKKAGTKVTAWVSYKMHTGKLDSNGKPIYVATTYEGAKHGPAAAAQMYAERQQKLMDSIRADREKEAKPAVAPAAPGAIARHRLPDGSMVQVSDTGHVVGGDARNAHLMRQRAADHGAVPEAEYHARKAAENRPAPRNPDARAGDRDFRPTPAQAQAAADSAHPRPPPKGAAERAARRMGENPTMPGTPDAPPAPAPSRHYALHPVADDAGGTAGHYVVPVDAHGVRPEKEAGKAVAYVEGHKDNAAAHVARLGGTVHDAPAPLPAAKAPPPPQEHVHEADASADIDRVHAAAVERVKGRRAERLAATLANPVQPPPFKTAGKPLQQFHAWSTEHPSPDRRYEGVIWGSSPSDAEHAAREQFGAHKVYSIHDQKNGPARRKAGADVAPPRRHAVPPIADPSAADLRAMGFAMSRGPRAQWLLSRGFMRNGKFHPTDRDGPSGSGGPGGLFPQLAGVGVGVGAAAAPPPAPRRFQASAAPGPDGRFHVVDTHTGDVVEKHRQAADAEESARANSEHAARKAASVPPAVPAAAPAAPAPAAPDIHAAIHDAAGRLAHSDLSPHVYVRDLRPELERHGFGRAEVDAALSGMEIEGKARLVPMDDPVERRGGGHDAAAVTLPSGEKRHVLYMTKPDGTAYRPGAGVRMGRGVGPRMAVLMARGFTGAGQSSLFAIEGGQWRTLTGPHGPHRVLVGGHSQGSLFDGPKAAPTPNATVAPDTSQPTPATAVVQSAAVVHPAHMWKMGQEEWKGYKNTLRRPTGQPDIDAIGGAIKERYSQTARAAHQAIHEAGDWIAHGDLADKLGIPSSRITPAAEELVKAGKIEHKEGQLNAPGGQPYIPDRYKSLSPPDTGTTPAPATPPAHERPAAPAAVTPEPAAGKPAESHEAAKHPWQMHPAEWDAAMDNLRPNAQGTGGDTRGGMGRATSMKGMDERVKAIHAERDRLTMGLKGKKIDTGPEFEHTMTGRYMDVPVSHRDVVEHALSQGHDVPADVLAHHPDISKPTVPPAAEPAKGAGYHVTIGGQKAVIHEGKVAHGPAEIVGREVSHKPGPAGEVRRAEAAPYNHVLRRNEDGTGEVTTKGEGWSDPKRPDEFPELFAEAKKALGLHSAWQQGDPVDEIGRAAIERPGTAGEPGKYQVYRTQGFKAVSDKHPGTMDFDEFKDRFAHNLQHLKKAGREAVMRVHHRAFVAQAKKVGMTPGKAELSRTASLALPAGAWDRTGPTPRWVAA